ncbi:MAG: YdhR family protein [Rhodospirillales bacterium]|nr:MAG: YdhR family protein [Rhodospirillales bacterium]
MVIVQINYRRPDMPKAEWEARYTDDLARQFLAVAGLQWKIWLDDEDERRCGGIYLFADRKSAEAYAAGPIVARMKANTALSDLTVRVFDVRAHERDHPRAGAQPADGGRVAGPVDARRRRAARYFAVSTKLGRAETRAK